MNNDNLVIALYVVWAIIAVIAVIVEVYTNALVGWAAVIAAFGAEIANGVTGVDPIWIQIVTFFGTWLLGWIILFFVLGKNRRMKMHDKEDGFLAFHGMKVKVSKGNESGYGELAINDKIFRFKSFDQIKNNDVVEIESIKGVTMTVKKSDASEDIIQYTKKNSRLHKPTMKSPTLSVEDPTETKPKRKAPAKKATAKKPATKKAPAKKPAAKKPVTKKATTKKTTVKKTTTKKTVAKKGSK